MLLFRFGAKYIQITSRLSLASALKLFFNVVGVVIVGSGVGVKSLVLTVEGALVSGKPAAVLAMLSTESLMTAYG